MEFNLTPDEAQWVARAIIDHYEEEGYAVQVEAVAFEDAPLTTTVFCRQKAKGAPVLLIEAQSQLNWDVLRELQEFLLVHKKHAELWIAIPEDASLSGRQVSSLNTAGVGLLFARKADGHVTAHLRARNHALVVTPEPTLRFQGLQAEIGIAVSKFNNQERKDGLRDLCEMVERLLQDVGQQAIARAVITLTQAQYDAKDFAGMIDTLASTNVYAAGKARLVDENLKVDLHAFRVARNLVDHPAGSVAMEIRRQQQFIDKMQLGLRMVSELLAIKRSIGR